MDLACTNCKTLLGNERNIESRRFRGHLGKAILITDVVGVKEGELLERNLTTGRHIVRDISCRGCNEVVGWTYVMADEPSEKYKLGKFILEDELLQKVEPSREKNDPTPSLSKL
ncbi:yippee zinc-binding/DNA-binding /Mis18, centromere assembly domain-containing protein [Pochonia chlamydosporia 170]|uniref:Protein yippee-like n=1 Tax=Pochonia chlamydosporia 170 TaxID=1380566 RepID=A0A219AQ16_METCM|nr:yippee zinc-binding/DNA-binding /Mis18, centromere assembly domain-containing protein [Pochonia chlamydosporia 170]OWT42897.1 yippee zinc-binding/DNA-binding /Mis18, centromere assembly domain-containing protein [Pochonia chlamydosporia 170]